MLSACSLQQEAGPFEQTGEIIALSGGDAGAQGACVLCHGLKGEGDGNLVPRLAGLDRGYFARAMEHYDAGQRQHPQMVWIAGRLDWPARQKLADYYAELPAPEADSNWRPDEGACSPATAALYHLGDPSRGLEACATCHGVDGLGVGAGNPALAGQPAPYLAAQLRAWRKGERYGDPLGAMTHVSRLLADAELSALAGYSSALQGATTYPESPAACLQTRRPDPRSGV
jgi:cytochrome c553